MANTARVRALLQRAIQEGGDATALEDALVLLRRPVVGPSVEAFDGWAGHYVDSDLVVPCAEAALQLQRVELAEELLRAFLATRPPATVFLVRAYYAMARVVAKSLASKRGKEAEVITLRALSYVLNGLRTATKSANLHELVGDGCALVWDVSAPLLREHARPLLIPAFEEITNLLESLGDQERTMDRLRFLSLLATAYDEAGRSSEAAAAGVKAYTHACKHGAPDQCVLALRLLVHVSRHQGTQSKLRSDLMAKGNPVRIAAFLLQQVSSGIVTDPKDIERDLEEASAQLLVRIDKNGKVLPSGSVEANMGSGEAGTEAAVAAATATKEKGNKELFWIDSTEAREGAGLVLAETGRMAAMHGLEHLAAQCGERAAASRDLRARVISEFIPVQLIHYRLARSEEAFLASWHDSNVGSTSAATTNLAGGGKKKKKAQDRGSRSDDSTSLILEPDVIKHLQFEALARLVKALVSARRCGDDTIVEMGCILIWNTCLPLLEESTYSKVHRPLEAAVDALAAIMSPLHHLRVMMHLEVAKCERALDFVAKALRHVERGLALDYSVSTGEKELYGRDRPLDRFLLPLRSRLILKTNVFKQPDRTEDAVQLLLEQVKEARGGHVAVSILTKACGLLDEASATAAAAPKGRERDCLIEEHIRLWFEVAITAWDFCHIRSIAERAAQAVVGYKVDPGKQRELAMYQARAYFILGQIQAVVELSTNNRKRSASQEDLSTEPAPAMGAARFFLHAMRLGVTMKLDWLILMACTLLYNHHLPLFREKRYLHLLPALEEAFNAVFPLPPYDVPLVLRVAHLLANGFEQSFQHDVQKAKTKEGGEVGLHRGREVLEKCITAFPMAQLDDLVSSLARLQRLRGAPVPAGPPERQVLSYIETAGMVAERTEKADLLTKAKKLMMECPSNLVLWTRMAMMFAQIGDWSASVESASYALRGLQGVAQGEISQKEWRWYSMAECLEGEAAAGMATPDKDKRFQFQLLGHAIDHFVKGVDYGILSDKPILAMTTAKHFWNAAVPFAASRVTRSVLLSPLRRIVEQLLRIPASHKLLAREQEFMTKIFRLLAMTLVDTSMWEDALTIINLGCSTVSERYHEDLWGLKLLCSSMLGRNIAAEVLQIKRFGPGAQAKILISLAESSPNRREQYAAYQRSLRIFEDSPMARVDVLMSLADWLHGEGFPLQDVTDAIMDAIELLMSADDREEEEVAEEGSVKSRMTFKSVHSRKSSAVASRPVVGRKGGRPMPPTILEEGLGHCSITPAVSVAGASGTVVPSVADVRRKKTKGLTLRELSKLVQLQGMLGIVAEESNKRLYHCLLAYHFLRRMWSLIITEINAVVEEKPATISTQRGIQGKGMGRSTRKEAGGFLSTSEPLTTTRKSGADCTPRRGADGRGDGTARASSRVEMVLALPSTLLQWATDRTFFSARSRSKLRAMTPQFKDSIDKPEIFLHYLDMIVETLIAHGHHLHCLPVYAMAELVAEEALQLPALTSIIHLRVASLLGDLHLMEPILTEAKKREGYEAVKTQLELKRMGMGQEGQDSTPANDRTMPNTVQGKRIDKISTRHLWYWTGCWLMNEGDHKSAKQFIDEALVHANAFVDGDLQALCLYQLAVLAHREGDLPTSEHYLARACEYGGDIRFWKGVIITRARLMIDRGTIAQGKAILLEGMEKLENFVCQEPNFTFEAARAQSELLCELGHICLEQGQEEDLSTETDKLDAAEYFRRAMGRMESLSDVRGLARISVLHANCLLSLNPPTSTDDVPHLELCRGRTSQVLENLKRIATLLQSLVWSTDPDELQGKGSLPLLRWIAEIELYLGKATSQLALLSDRLFSIRPPKVPRITSSFPIMEGRSPAAVEAYLQDNEQQFVEPLPLSLENKVHIHLSTASTLPAPRGVRGYALFEMGKLFLRQAERNNSLDPYRWTVNKRPIATKIRKGGGGGGPTRRHSHRAAASEPQPQPQPQPASDDVPPPAVTPPYVVEAETPVPPPCPAVEEEKVPKHSKAGRKLDSSSGIVDASVPEGSPIPAHPRSRGSKEKSGSSHASERKTGDRKASRSVLRSPLRASTGGGSASGGGRHALTLGPVPENETSTEAITAAELASNLGNLTKEARPPPLDSDSALELLSRNTSEISLGRRPASVESTVEVLAEDGEEAEVGNEARPPCRLCEQAVVHYTRALESAMLEEDTVLARLVALGLVDCLGRRNPCQVAEYLVLAQSCRVREELLRLAVISAGDWNIEAFYMKQRSQLLSSETRSNFFQDINDFLMNNSPAFRRLDIRVPFGDILKKLPSDFRVVLLETTDTADMVYAACITPNIEQIKVYRRSMEPEWLSALHNRIEIFRSAREAQLLAPPTEEGVGAINAEWDAVLNETEAILGPILLELRADLVDHTGYVVLLPGCHLAEIPLEALELVPKRCKGISRDFSLHVLYQRLVTLSKGDASLKAENTCYLVDPRDENTADCSTCPLSTGFTNQQSASIFSRKWTGIHGSHHIPSQGEWQNLLQRGSTFLFLGYGSCLDYLDPGSLGALTLTNFPLVMLLDGLVNDASRRRRARLDQTRRTRDRRLTEPSSTAALFSLRGAQTVVLSLFPSSPLAHRRLMYVLVNSVRQYERSIGEILRLSSAETPGSYDESVPGSRISSATPSDGPRATEGEVVEEGPVSPASSRGSSPSPSTGRQGSIMEMTVGEEANTRPGSRSSLCTPSFEMGTIVMYGLPNLRMVAREKERGSVKEKDISRREQRSEDRPDSLPPKTDE